MKIRQRAFPHPVVGNGDDVAAGFQTPVQVYRRGDNFEVEITCQMSSKSLQRHIDAKRATYGLHVECSKTFFRRLMPLKIKNGRATQRVPLTSVSGSVELNVVIYAKTEIARYRAADSHGDYGKKSFYVSEGDFLAVTEGHLFNADIHQDMLQSIDSIMEIRQHGDSKPDMDVDFGGEKILILLPKADFETYRLLRNDPTFQNVAISSIVLPALMEALRFVGDDSDDFSDCRWYDNLRLRLANKEIDSEDGILANAQQLLEMPIGRTLKVYRDQIEESDGDET